MKDEIFEEDLEQVVGGVPQEVGEEMARDLIYGEEEKAALDEMFYSDFEEIKVNEQLDNEGHIVK